MIKNFFLLTLACVFIVAVEAAATAVIDTRWRPDLSLLTVIFVTLSLGFRYGFISALVAGALKESFGSQGFGMALVPYLVCAYLADYLKHRFALRPSLISRLAIVLSCLLVQIVIQMIFFLRWHPVDFAALTTSILIPQILVTMLVSEIFFNMCRPCASKLFV